MIKIGLNSRPKRPVSRKAKTKTKRKRVSIAQQQELSKAAWESQVAKKPIQKFRKKKRKIEIISRKTQPQWKITVSVARLKKQEGVGGKVSSSWISSLEWTGSGWVYMVLLNGYSYNVYIPFKIWEGWYYAHSKGTYFNEIIKGKFKVVRSA